MSSKLTGAKPFGVVKLPVDRVSILSDAVNVIKGNTIRLKPHGSQMWIIDKIEISKSTRLKHISGCVKYMYH